MKGKLLLMTMLLASCSPPVAAQVIQTSNRVMQPLILTTSLKAKGHKYSFTFSKGKEITPVRSLIIPLKVEHNGPVILKSNKTKLSYDVYSNEACTHKCIVNRPGMYYVKVTQSAYSIDLLDHQYAQFKKAGITFYVSQANADDITLGEKKYAVISGQPKVRIQASKGTIRLRGQTLDTKGKYVYGGRFTVYDSTMKELGVINGDGKILVTKGNYVLIPDGQTVYRLKYTMNKAPYMKNTSIKKARLLKKTHNGAFYRGESEKRYYKVKLENAKTVNFMISGITIDEVTVLTDDQEKVKVRMSKTKDGRSYSTAKLKAGTYYIRLLKNVTKGCGALYTITLL